MNGHIATETHDVITALERGFGVLQFKHYKKSPVSHFSTTLQLAHKAAITMSNQQSSSSSSEKETIFRVAIVGGGITGACVASILASLPASPAKQSSCSTLEPQANTHYKDWFRTNHVQVEVHLYDQGKSGVGGRSSHRVAKNDQGEWLGQWDHGCQVRTT